MSEKFTPRGNEKLSSAESQDVKEQLGKIAERLRENAEKESTSNERKTASVEARKSAEKLAVSGKEQAPGSSEKQRQKSSAHRHEKKQTYKATIRRVEAKLPAYQRSFSKVINNDTVDKVSNVAGRTVARPSGILGAGIFAFIGMAIVTYVANKQGFRVNSGAVFMSLLLIGWLAGISLEGLTRLLRKR
jgi:hypothetical protein